MAKQRRNRERATELITVLDGMVPAKYPYRAFSLPASGAELSLQKRSRNMTLEDVIDAVRAAVGKDLEKSKKKNRASEGKVSIRDVMNASREVFAVAVLQEDGEILEASDSLKRMLSIQNLKGQRAFIGCGGWNVDEITGVGTCETRPEDVLLCQMDACSSATSEKDSLRTLLVYRDAHNLSQEIKMQRSLIPPKLELPEPGIDTGYDSVFSTLANTARNTAFNTACNTACNSIAIRAEDLAAQLAAREGGNMSDTINNMGSIGHSSQGMYPDPRMGMGNMMRGGMPGMMSHMSQSLPQKPAMGSSSLMAAEKAFMDALRRLEYERSQEAARSECGSISYQADQLGSLQGARSQCGSVRFSLDALDQKPSAPNSVNMVNPMLAQQQMQQGYAPSQVQQVPVSMGAQGGGMMGSYNMGGYPAPDMQQEQFMGSGMGVGGSPSPMGPPMGLPSRMQTSGMMGAGAMGADPAGQDMQAMQIGQYGNMSHGGRSENDFSAPMPPNANQGDEWSRLELDEFRPQYMGNTSMGMEMPPPEFEAKPQINRNVDDMNQFMVPSQKMPQQGMPMDDFARFSQPSETDHLAQDINSMRYVRVNMRDIASKMSQPPDLDEVIDQVNQ
uniref:Uncharacterized protein n=1 Tax=Hanusia phi TaxID=3032 RepID=A0A7S0HBJ9_9CRYP|mmetsp:Transcript_11668/g.26728  ORF Transcript_11668/g.26728 Transcript_11668/m.26728 type:complete len:616 (+) Transcript_11668:244-2091(+)